CPPPAPPGPPPNSRLRCICHFPRGVLLFHISLSHSFHPASTYAPLRRHTSHAYDPAVIASTFLFFSRGRSPVSPGCPCLWVAFHDGLRRWPGARRPRG